VIVCCTIYVAFVFVGSITLSKSPKRSHLCSKGPKGFTIWIMQYFSCNTTTIKETLPQQINIISKNLFEFIYRSFKTS